MRAKSDADPTHGRSASGKGEVAALTGPSESPVRVRLLVSAVRRVVQQVLLAILELLFAGDWLKAHLLPFFWPLTLD